MFSPSLKARQLAVMLVTTVWLGISAYAQSGLPSRPLNLTCTAPESPSQSFTLERAVLSAESKAHSGSGRESGVFYRGASVPSLQGHFVYLQDNRLIVESTYGHGGAGTALPLSIEKGSVIAEGVDSELYVVTTAGGAYQLSQVTGSSAAPAATLLSNTGCFEASDPSIPTAGLIEYRPSAPLWTDGAGKRRWIAMPDWDQSGTQITVLPDGDFEFPVGTVLAKEFGLDGTLVETRLMVKDLNGDWTGYTYEWNAEQTDATLLTSGKVGTVNGQEWTFPSPFECLYCHSTAANRSLGIEIAQLNNAMEYSATGITANQLTTLVSIGLIDAGIGDVSTLDTLPAYDDASKPIDARARGYLHSNCSQCHRPGGPGVGPEDFRYQLTGNEIGANDTTPWLGNLGVEGAKLLVRGQPDRSVLALRMKNTSFYRMPPLGTSMVDDQGVALIEGWIASGLGFGIGDADGDVKADDLDNCTLVANPDQLDVDADGFGNICDPDLNNDGVVNFLDLSQFSGVFLTDDALADFDGDGTVNFVDLSILANLFFMPPGPSGLVP